MTIAPQVIPDNKIDAMIEEMGQEEALAEWMKTRPQHIQDFHTKHGFLPGVTIEINGCKLYFLGYGEQNDKKVGLIVTLIDPSEDYDLAVSKRQHICADHFN